MGEGFVLRKSQSMVDLRGTALRRPSSCRPFGGLLGMGDKLFAVPWSALKLDTGQKCFVLHASKEYLENAPGFDKDDWPTFADEEWARHIHSYYQSLPYWE